MSGRAGWRCRPSMARYLRRTGRLLVLLDIAGTADTVGIAVVVVGTAGGVPVARRPLGNLCGSPLELGVRGSLALGPSPSAWHDATTRSRVRREAPRGECEPAAYSPTYWIHNCGISVLAPGVRVQHGTARNTVWARKEENRIQIKPRPRRRTGMSWEERKTRADDKALQGASRGLGHVEPS